MITRTGAPPRTAYTVAEVAASLGLSTKTIRRRIASGEIEVTRFGTAVRIPVAVFNQLTQRTA